MQIEQSLYHSDTNPCPLPCACCACAADSGAQGGYEELEALESALTGLIAKRMMDKEQAKGQLSAVPPLYESLPGVSPTGGRHIQARQGTALCCAGCLPVTDVPASEQGVHNRQGACTHMAKPRNQAS
eukprot:1141970-Pelagomonas_calceolata.AAC.2